MEAVDGNEVEATSIDLGSEAASIAEASFVPDPPATLATLVVSGVAAEAEGLDAAVAGAAPATVLSEADSSDTIVCSEEADLLIGDCAGEDEEAAA